MIYFRTVITELTKKNKVILQVVFWMLYYILFSLIWVKDNDYKASFFLEFVLLPIRILAVYVCILYLIPRYLLRKKFGAFIFLYGLLLIFSSVTQRLFTYFFVENSDSFNLAEILHIGALIRSSILINTTVLLISAVYILILYFKEREKNEENTAKMIELKSNRRTHIISTHTIVYIEGLGNYVNYHLHDNSKITVYQSLKRCLKELESDQFIRIQKSFIINTDFLRSYDNDTVEMLTGASLPIGAKFDTKKLSIHGA